jgi:S1-C subfamily serine protease
VRIVKPRRNVVNFIGFTCHAPPVVERREQAVRRSQNVSAPVAAVVIAVALAIFFLVFNRPSQEVATPSRPVPEAPPVDATQLSDMSKGLSPLGVIAVIPPLLEDRGRGVRVAAVLKDSPAARVELQGGDFILTFDGKSLMSSDALIFLLALVQPQQTYQMEVVRSGETMKIAVTGITPLPPEEQVRF